MEMVGEAKFTPGPVSATHWERHIFVGGGPNNDDIAELFNFADEHTVKITREEAIANAGLFAEAINVATESGLTPRQLLDLANKHREQAQVYLEQRADLLMALQHARDAIASLPEDALGFDGSGPQPNTPDDPGDSISWPIQAEILHEIDTALSKATTP